MVRFLFLVSIAMAQGVLSEAAVDCPPQFAKLSQLRPNSSRGPAEPVWRKSGWGEANLHYSGYVLNKADYEGFREAALAVNQIAGSNPVIAVGRSPSPVSAFLSIIDEDRTANLPISKFRHRMKTSGESAPIPERYREKEEAFEPLSLENEKKLFEHFDKTLLSFLKSKSGPVFLMDVGESGASLFSMQQYLAKYGTQRGLNVKFESILMTNSFFSSNVEKMATYFGVRTNKVILDENKFIEDTLKDPKLKLKDPRNRDGAPKSPWDHIAAFEGYDFDYIASTGRTTVYNSWEGMTVDVPSGKPNSDLHDRFKSALLIHMVSDQSLKQTWPNPPVIEVDVPGISWDPEKKVYRDEEGKVWKLKTD